MTLRPTVPGIRTSLRAAAPAVALALAAALAPGCGQASAPEPEPSEPAEDLGLSGPFEDGEPMGKEDNAGVPGPLVATNTSETQVWTARNAWEDTDTQEAKAAGMAWDADSGLNWDQKYVRWTQSMQRTPSVAGYYDTFTLSTPWGKALPAPKLECSEVAIFLRIAFASWYGLPFYMTSVDGKGARVYFGHFGARTATSRYGNTPRYALSYEDHSGMTEAEIAAQGWPRDEKLRARGLSGGGDDMGFVAPGARAGAYFDEVFLNKRVGHFMWMMLDYFGSMNLANSRNTFNIVPQALQAGDVLVERWQRNGIGHTLVVKQVTPIEGGKLEALLVSGSMPRRQPRWDDAVASKRYFTSAETGGEGSNYEGDEYVKLGGGLKRWRVTKNVKGYWTNTWMKADEASWINDTSYERLKTRPKELDSLLGEVPPEQLRAALLKIIDDARAHLRSYPASCSARTNREKAFAELVALNQKHFGLSQSQTDKQYRILDDHVFAELVYEKSKTCCWNSTTSAMYEIVVALNQARQTPACQAPVVFKASGGGYQTFADYAKSVGKSAQWKPWSEDEPCAQRDVADDTETDHAATPWCS
jgi:hypothetical protein